MDLNPSMKFLNESIINLLKNDNILTVSDFIKEDLYKLTEITKLNPDTITKAKESLVKLLIPFEGPGLRKEIIKTGIDRYES